MLRVCLPSIFILDSVHPPFSLDPSHLSSLIEIIVTLLRYRSSLSIGSVAVAFDAVCPTRLDLLHKHYRRLCRMLSVDREEEIDKDVKLLLNSTEPLFFSSYPAALFSPFYSRFILSSDDLRKIKIDKIKMLLIIVTFDNYPTDYAEDIDNEEAAASIHAIGRCASIIPECVQQSLTALIGMINSPHDTIVNTAVVVLKNMVQAQLTSRRPATIARACVVWLVGQYAALEEGTPSRLEGAADWAPDVLRKMAKTFSQEASVVKLQVITLAAKLFVLCPVDQILGRLNQYIFLLARYDTNYDVHNRARMLSSLLSGINSSIPVTNSIDTPAEHEGVLRREQVRMVLFKEKAGIIDSESVVSDPHVMLGSSSAVTGKPTLGEPRLPDWLEKGVESTLRDTEEDIAPLPAVPIALSSAEQQRMRE
ncbi:armadillo-type protein [Armillaria nabsnona]|nr:armadillo-type protein [Armillaria nabsnona]